MASNKIVGFPHVRWWKKKKKKKKKKTKQQQQEIQPFLIDEK